MTDRKDIVLADCESEELEDLIKGLNESLGIKLEVHSKLANKSHTKLYNIYRYWVYMVFPIKYFLNRRKYRYIICWQQFYALFFCLYCRIFRTKKTNIVIACNYTYKEKKILTNLYKRFFSENSSGIYLDKIHVLSNLYAEKCSNELKIDIDKFAVVPFGIPDTHKEWLGTKVKYDDYAFAIGRSNRDFNFLVRAWKKMPESRLLIIASDTFKPSEKLPSNIIHRTDITDDRQYPYIVNCSLMIIPIDDGSICSGDTVLLKAMSYMKPLVVTKPSTLGEMYINDGINGILIEKNVDVFANKVEELLNNPELMRTLGRNARQKFEECYSRYQMGVNLGKAVKL